MSTADGASHQLIADTVGLTPAVRELIFPQLICFEARVPDGPITLSFSVQSGVER